MAQLKVKRGSRFRNKSNGRVLVIRTKAGGKGYWFAQYASGGRQRRVSEAVLSNKFERLSS